MKISELITRCKIKIPSIKTTGIDDDDLTVIINDGIVQVNLIAKCYRGYTNFNIVSGTSTYSLAQIAPTFQQMVTAGLWFSSTGQVTDLKRVIPRTEEWLNKRLPSWRSATPATLPQYYYQSGDNLQIYPPANSAIQNGGRLHHLIMPTIAIGDNYPFTGTAVEITAFRPFDRAIVEYVRSELDPALDKESGEDLSYPRFLQLIDTAKRQVKAKPDAINYYDVAMGVST